MQEEDKARTVDRRRLLRRAGTLAAGVAGAGVASAVVATPAQAADGQSLTIGQDNTGTATTKLTAPTGAVTKPAVRLENPNGSALSVLPTNPDEAAPTGSLFVDGYGDVAAIGNADANGNPGAPYITYLYSPTWATMVVPIKPIRWLDTRNAAGRAHIVPGSANLDSLGRVRPKNSIATPDMIIDLTDIFLGGYGAVQANLTVAGPAASGWASMWDSGNFPNTSSINYNVPMPAGLANFTQTLIGPDKRIRLKTSQVAHFFLDIVGFVVTDPFAQLAASASGMSASTLAKGTGTTQRRRPPMAR